MRGEFEHVLTTMKAITNSSAHFNARRGSEVCNEGFGSFIAVPWRERYWAIARLGLQSSD